MKMGSDRLYREVIFRLTMSEGRQSQVVLLDDYRLDILIKPKLYAGELLDMVASHFNLKEKEYFGLCYIDDTGHQNWLQLDRRVLEHDFPRKSSQTTLILFFRIKYFVESITQLRDSATVEAFYLQAQSLVYQGVFEVSSAQAFNLAALVLQAAYGDYVSDEATRETLKKLPVIPTSTLLEHPSLSVCEKRVIEEYKTLAGLSRGNAIVNYMQTVESLPTYGVHYYEVKDKAGLPWWLGISYKGICQYDLTDKKVPRKVFLWKQLENLYFRDRKFSIEVHDPKRPTSSRKTFGAGNICVHVWFAINPSLTKCIWSMAISQHQFYLDRKHKTVQPISRNLSEIAAELTHESVRSNASTNSTALSRSGSTHSLPALKISGDSFVELKAETVEMLVTLKARKEALEEALHKKSEELKKLCLQEGALTGILPPEMPLSPGEQIPLTRKRDSSEFSLSERLSWKKKTKEEKELADLELEYEIQNKIATACGKLASDPSVKKTVRRQRKMSFQKAQSKLKELENKLQAFKRKVEKIKKEQLCQYSDDDHTEDTVCQSADENDQHGMNTSSHSIVSQDSKTSACDTTSSSPLTSTLHSPGSSSAPSSPVKPRQNRIIYRKTRERVEPHHRCRLADHQGYTPSSVYLTQTSYRSQQYPTLPTRLPNSYSAGAVLEYCSTKKTTSNAVPKVLNLVSPYQNKFESTLDIDGSNLYSVPTQRTSQAFDTQDDILASLPSSQQDLGLMSRHNSLDRRRRHSIRKQCYFEHKRASMVAEIHSPSSDSEQLLSGSANTMASPTYEVHHPHYFHHQRYANNYSRVNEEERTHRNTFFSHTFSEGLSNYCHSPSESVCTSCLHGENVCRRLDYSNYSTSSSYYDLKPYHYTENQVHSSLSPSSTEDDRCYLIPKVRESGVCNAGLELSNTQLESYQNTQSKMRNLQIDSPSNTLPRSHCRLSPTLRPSDPSTRSSPNVEISVVRYGEYHAYWEETKPYEISDFYKYSKKHRQQCLMESNKNQAATGRTQSFQDGHSDSLSSNSESAQRVRVPDSMYPCSSDYGGSAADRAHPAPSNNSREPPPPDRLPKPEKVKRTTLV